MITKYPKIIYLLDDKQISYLNLGQKIRLKKTVTHMECILLLVQLDLKLKGQVYVIILIHIYLWVELQITRKGVDDDRKLTDERNKGVIFKNCAPFVECTSEINNNEIDYAKDLHSFTKYLRQTLVFVWNREKF